MNHRCGPWLFFGVLVLLAIPKVTPAQEGPNSSGRRPYGIVQPQGDLEQILKDNLLRLKDMETLRDLAEHFGKNSKLAEKFRGLIDPEMQERWEKGTADFENDPKMRKALDELLNKIGTDVGLLKEVEKRSPSLGKKLAKPKDRDRLKKLIQPDPQPVPKPGPRPPIPPQGPAIPGSMPHPTPPPPISNPDSDEDFTRTIHNWLERAGNWEGFGDLIKKSPTIQEAIEDLTVSLLTNEGDGSWDAGDWASRFGDVADYAEKGFSVFGDGFSAFENFPTPSLPNIPMPPVGNMPSFNLPNLGSPGPVGGGGFSFAHLLLWLGAILTLALVFWQLWQRYAHPPVTADGGPGWRLGAWPVNPAKVATRAELIQAFEFLSLLLLGPAARTWNHRDIAVSIGGDATPSSAPQRAAADRLAALYEEARYAPGDEPLPLPALEEARRNLCLLAGVAAT